MPTFKTIKKICMEAFQLAAFSTPIFVTGQRLATKECSNGNETCPPTETDPTSYWLFISAIISYVAGITLLIWIPVKLFITWKKLYRPYEGLWFPGNVLYIIFAYIPCVAAVLVGHEVCTGQDYCFDFFRGAPIETMVIMMVVTDWSEKIRYIKLRSSDDTVRTKKYPYADWNETKRQRSNGYGSSSADDIIATMSRRSSLSQRSLLHSGGNNGSFWQKTARSLKWTDARPENLLRDLMLAYDTRLILGLSLLNGDGSRLIFETVWVYPIYILSCLSVLPFVFSPNSKVRSSITVIFQDIPFFILRIAISAKFGSYLVLQTSMLFLLKNFFATFAFFYFNVILPWRNRKRKSQEYELEQVERNNSAIDTIDHQTAIKAAAGVGYAEARNGYAMNGIANPGYRSKRRHNDDDDDNNNNDSRDYHQSAREDDHPYSTRDRRQSTRDQNYSPGVHRHSPRDQDYSPREQHYSPRYQDYSPENQRHLTRDQDYSPRDQRHATRDQRPSARYHHLHQAGEEHYSPRHVEEPRYEDQEFFDDPTDVSDDELYPTRRRMAQPEQHVARMEQNSSPQFATYHQPTQNEVVINRLDQGRESKKSPSARPELAPKPKVINYDTLNDPTSFLYSKNARQERRSIKPKIANIDFGSSQTEDRSTNDIQPVQPIPKRTKQENPVSKPQSRTVGHSNTDVTTNNEASNGGTVPDTSNEPTYAVVDRKKIESRRRAPPPPTSRNANPQEKADVLPPPPDQRDDETAAGASRENSRNRDSLYTPNIARQLADEAINRRTRKEEKEVLDALDEAVQHGKTMINSQSTTPKSTISAPVMNGVIINDEDYDDRL